MTDQLQQAEPRLRPRGPQAQQTAATAADTTGVQSAAISAPWLRVPSRLLASTPDGRLVDALRRGDERAFEAIYDRHHRALLGFCRHMLGSREEAEDALQQVFVGAHRHLLEGTERVELKPWLYAIARNRCLSMLRARRDTCTLEPALEPSTDGLAVADEVERREDIQELLGDLTRLPDEQRAALLLAEMGDLSQQEIAVALDVRTAKVKALVFQAREALAGWRQARTTDCREIQGQLATLRGSALRRAPIRRHVALCVTCAAFEREVARQRSAIALLLPVVPTAALKHSVLSGAISAGNGAASAAVAGAAASGMAASGAAVSGAGAGVVASGASGVAVKALAAAALAIGAGGGGAVAVRELTPPSPRSSAPARTPARTAAPATAPVPTPEPSAPGAASHPHATPATPSKRDGPRGRHADARGRSEAHRANGRGSRKAAKVRRGPANRTPKTSRPAPATSRRPERAKSPAAKAPAAKAPAAKAPAAKAPAAKAPPAKAPAAKAPRANGRGRTSPPGAQTAPGHQNAAPPAVPNGKAKAPPASGRASGG